MSGPLLALRGAILAALGADAPLAGLMGGALRLYDEPPRAAEPLYALFGEAEAREDDVDGATRTRHRVSLVVWARPGSARSALDAAERMAAVLDGADLAPAGHRLVLIRREALRTGRDAATNLATATLVLAAITEAV